MDVIILQPPLVQLNTAYPSGAYLCSFFKAMGANASWYDLSNALFRKIFSRQGLATLFELSRQKALDAAQSAELSGDSETAFQLRRYVSQAGIWCDWIEPIVSILCDKNPGGRELCHRFIFSPHVPRGMRMERFLESLDREPSSDDARFLATMALADISDYITAVFDPQFSLVRYGESLAVNETSFQDMEKSLDSPVMTTFFEPLLNELFASRLGNKGSGKKTLVCLSVPFPGTFSAGLYAGKWLKKNFGDSVFIAMGGGFVNTELRQTQEKSLSFYIDALSYDRGYGSYKALFDANVLSAPNLESVPQLYKMRLFTPSAVIEPLWQDREFERFENEQTSCIIPDFSDIDFSLYPRMEDDTNPMQRMWSDGAWLKAYLAHGCYWHQCDFCDVTLDYVSAYRMTNIENLYKGLKVQADAKGVYGIHFVDEAMPPLALQQFCAFNAADRNLLSFWGNIRFERNYTRDVADFLSYGGLTGVSGGIEIATGRGLSDIHKGTNLDSIVASCCAFKEAGILVHAYMIYGWWQESAQDLIDSMETLRQLYANGLLDSSFWHKFVLTRHSRVYDEWKKGMHPELKPIEPKNAGIFAKNGMHFEGEERSQKYGQGLNAALQAWMHGQDLDRPVGSWFSFKTPRPTVAPDRIERAVELYEQNRSSQFNAPLKPQNLFWTGGQPYLLEDGKYICWNYMQEQFRVKTGNAKPHAEEIAGLLWNLRPQVHDTEAAEKMAAQNEEAFKLLKKFRGKGLIQLDALKNFHPQKSGE